MQNVEAGYEVFRSRLACGLPCPAELLCGCMDLGLQGRVALVVGGSGLIGQAIVERLRAEGATAVVAARHATDGIILDARDIASVTTAIAQLLERHNRLDALVVAAAPSAQTLDASRHAESSIEDYAERTEQTVTAWKGMNGQQGGDPAKLADALVYLADQDQPPLRFAAGADAVAAFERRAKHLLAQADAYRDLSSSLAFEVA